MSQIKKTEQQWQAELGHEAYEILRQKGTEQPFTGDLLNETRTGVFLCAGCGAALFESATKYNSHSGWPSFWQPIREDAVIEEQDLSLGHARTEVLCRSCEGHLGHVFEDGPEPTGLRYCINSRALTFDPQDI